MIYVLFQISGFFWTVLGHFSQCDFKIFFHRPTLVANICTQNYHKKASYGPAFTQE